MKNSSDIPGYGWTNTRVRPLLRNKDKNDDNKDDVDAIDDDNDDDRMKSGFNCMLCSYRNLPTWHFKVNNINLYFHVILLLYFVLSASLLFIYIFLYYIYTVNSIENYIMVIVKDQHS